MEPTKAIKIIEIAVFAVTRAAVTVFLIECLQCPGIPVSDGPTQKERPRLPIKADRQSK